VQLVVIGVGSRQGDDAAGLVVAERLAQRGLPQETCVTSCERPLDLLPWLARADTVVLVDAVRSGARPGTVHRLRAGDLRAGDRLSSHALGVAEVLALAAALGQCRARVEIVGIEACACGGDAPALTPAVADAVARVADWLGERLAALGPGQHGVPG
jgi:hydrogenase maturation protease